MLRSVPVERATELGNRMRELKHLTWLWCSAVPYYAVPCRAVHCTAVHCSALQCSAVQCRAVPCRAVPCSTVQCSFRSGRFGSGRVGSGGAVKCSANNIKCQCHQPITQGCCVTSHAISLASALVGFHGSVRGVAQQKAGRPDGRLADAGQRRPGLGAGRSAPRGRQAARRSAMRHGKFLAHPARRPGADSAAALGLLLGDLGRATKFGAAWGTFGAPDETRMPEGWPSALLRRPPRESLKIPWRTRVLGAPRGDLHGLRLRGRRGRCRRGRHRAAEQGRDLHLRHAAAGGDLREDLWGDVVDAGRLLALLGQAGRQGVVGLLGGWKGQGGVRDGGDRTARSLRGLPAPAAGPARSSLATQLLNPPPLALPSSILAYAGWAEPARTMTVNVIASASGN